jgi:integrin alpha FG-GAP repeat containing protein 1
VFRKIRQSQNITYAFAFVHFYSFLTCDNPQPFGVSYSGATYKYTILDTTGKRSAAQISQLPQTSYHALQTPYSFFGLGRTNNYIENLFVGSTRKLPAESARRMQERRALNISSNLQRYVEGHPETSIEEKDEKGAGAWYLSSSGEGVHYISMEGVIPNSKLVIIPPNSPEGGTRDWKQELYLRPGEWIPWVTVTLVIATMILGIIVWIFHWNEKVSCLFSNGPFPF